MRLSDKQIRFVNEYLIDLNGAQAAIRSGFSRRSARQIATRLLSKADIMALVRKKQQETEERLQITRDDILTGLLMAAREAKVAGDPMGMIKAYREIGLMMGYYDQPQAPTSHNICNEQVRAMSDEELDAMIN